jgi:hypothetical protein
VDRTGVLVRVDGGEGDVTGEAEATGVGDCDDDGVLCTGNGSNTVGEGPSVASLVVRRSSWFASLWDWLIARVLPTGTSWEAGAWDGSIGKVTVERRLCGLCGLFGSRDRDGKEVVRESFPRLRVEGTIGVCAARAGMWRNVDVFRVRVEVGDELVLGDAVGLASGTIAGDEVDDKGVAGTLGG